MGVMIDMSRAIRSVLESHGKTLREIPTDVLEKLEQVVTAFSRDLRGEVDRRRRGDAD